MRDQTWFTLVALSMGVGVVLAGFVAVSWGSSTAAPSAPAATSTSVPAVDLMYLTIAFNPSTGTDEYFPANFTLPAHELIEFTITSYDNGTNVVPASAAMVMGTVGGVAELQAAPGDRAMTFSQLPMDRIAHTFTVQSPTGGSTAMGMGGSPSYLLNVPVESAASLASPAVVTFSAYFNQTGSLAWMCLAPCDPTAMLMAGFMSGTISVV